MSTPTERPELPRPPRHAVGETSAPAPDRRRTTRAWVAVAVAVVCAMALATLVLALRGARPETTAQPPAPLDRSVSGPLGGRQEAQFDLLSGADSVTVRSADIGDDLYRASTPDGSSVIPRVTEINDRIELTLYNSGVAGPATAEVLLSSKVRWRLKLAGGGSEEVVDFAAGKLSAVELTAGAGRIELSLPAPEGTLVVTLAGGAGELIVRLPQGAPVQVRLGSGAGGVTVDGKKHEGLAAGTVLTPDGWDKAADWLDVDAAGGVSTVTVSRA